MGRRENKSATDSTFDSAAFPSDMNNQEHELVPREEGSSELSQIEPPSTSSEREYQTIGDPALLDKIDRLLAYNVGEYIDLPQ